MLACNKVFVIIMRLGNGQINNAQTPESSLPGTEYGSAVALESCGHAASIHSDHCSTTKHLNSDWNWW